MDNYAMIVGNLSRDPELRYTTSGVAVASFSVAINERRKNQNGEWEDGETSFINCVAWRELGEHVAQTLQKGSRAVVQGKLKQRSWETDDGAKRSTIELVVSEIGPSLRWATAKIEKVNRSHTDDAPARQPQQQRQPDPVYGDEEPF